MSIILALLAAMGGVATLLWRLNGAAAATRDIASAANDLAGLKRRWSWRRKADVDPIRLVEDPRIAAVTMMAGVAQSDGALTSAERAAILRQATEHFACTAKTAEELLSYARFLLGDRPDPADVFLKLKPVIQKCCDAKERADLVEMLRAVAATDGPMGDAERVAIAAFERELSL